MPIVNIFGLLFFSLALPQTPPPVLRSTQVSTAPIASPKEARELPPEQKRALKLLDSYEVQARKTDNATRAYVLYRIALAYEPYDQAKAKELLSRALTASLGIDNYDAQAKAKLQAGPAMELARLAPLELEHLLPQLSPDVRGRVLGRIVDADLGEKRFDNAAALVTNTSANDEVPYATMIHLMEKLPPELSADRARLFTAALSDVRLHPQTTLTLGGNGLDTMILRFWRDLPSDLVETGIRELLSQATTKEPETDTPSTAGFAMAGGAPSLSPYEYRLAQLLPVLREIAPNEAKDLEKEHPKVKAGLETFGQQRFDHPEPIERRAQAPGEEVGAEPALPRTSNRPGGSQDSGSEAATPARVNEQSAARARFALDRASRLPARARAKALEGVAVHNQRSDPKDATRALEELVNTVDELPLSDRPHYLESAAELYLAMNNRDAGLKVIDRGLDTALKIYTQDSSSSQQDRVPKALWPSTRSWEKLIHLAAEVAPDRARQALEAIPDDAIRLIEQVEFAAVLLRTPAVSQSDEAPCEKPLNSSLSNGEKPPF